MPGEDEGSFTCPACGRRVDLPGQLAFLRAEEAFLSVAQEVAQVSWRGDGRSVFRAKAPPDSLPLPSEVVRAYQQAYNGLRMALAGELAADQAMAACRMLAEITRLLAPRAMASPLEAEYWSKRTVTAVAQQELDANRESEADAARSPVFDSVRRFHRRLRRRQLRRVLARLECDLVELEHAIGFLDPSA